MRPNLPARPALKPQNFSSLPNPPSASPLPSSPSRVPSERLCSSGKGGSSVTRKYPQPLFSKSAKIPHHALKPLCFLGKRSLLQGSRSRCWCHYMLLSGYFRQNRKLWRESPRFGRNSIGPWCLCRPGFYCAAIWWTRPAGPMVPCRTIADGWVACPCDSRHSISLYI